MYKRQLIEITQAYSLFANSGTLTGAAAPAQSAANGPQDQILPRAILEVKDQLGTRWDVQSPASKPVTNAQLAYLINHMLSDETLRRQTLGHPNDFEIARPVAAKQGQGLIEPSTWTIGYTPDLVVGVWVGQAPDAKGISKPMISQRVASGLWHAVMKTATQGDPIHDWAEPVGIIHQVVCDPSGICLLYTSPSPRD